MENLEIKESKDINKNSMGTLNSRMKKTGERVNKIKDKTGEITQSD